MSIGMVIALIKKLGVTPDPEVIEAAVNDWLDEHPEAACPIDDTAGEGDTDKVLSADKVTELVNAVLEAIASQKPPVEYKFSGDDLLLGFGFSTTLDYVAVLNNGRANGLFDFAKLCTKAKGASLENLSTSDLTTVWSSGTDMHGPFQFLALNNADGYHSDAQSAGFTGGNHTLDDMGTGFETAESVYVLFYADGTPVSSGFGHANNFEIRWANDVQAYNTVKQGGGGRACLREYHDMVFDGETFKERVTLKALEAITMSLWYGLQCVSIGTTYTNIAFVDATNREKFSSSDSDIKSGNTTTSGFIGWGDTHRIEMNVDTGIDLGKRTYYNGTNGAFVANSKGYFFIVNQSISMNAGAQYFLDGSYRFIPTIIEVEPEPPSETLTLNKYTITVDSAEGTDTLVATHEPSSPSDEFSWSSSDTNVATVNSSGVVTVHGIGTATITVTCGNLTAQATVTQTSIKQEGLFAKKAPYYISGDSVTGGKILAVHYIEGQKSCGQEYSYADDLRIKQGTATFECVRVPYGATKMKFATTDGERHGVSYVEVVDTSSIITVDGLNYPEWKKHFEWVYSDTGCDVEYGEAVAIRALTADADCVSYIYFT